MQVEAIVPLYGRLENTFPIVERLLVSSSRRPDWVQFIGEREGDYEAVLEALDELYRMELIDARIPDGVIVTHLPTPTTDGAYDVIPYSFKINHALDRSSADAHFYVDNGSMPDPQKVQKMAAALEKQPKWQAVYCTQKRTGYMGVEIHEAREVIPDGFGQVNFTQVMHRPCRARWTLDMTYSNPDLADAIFWRAIARELGPLHPVGGATVLDVHDMPSPAANGLEP